MVAWKLSAAVLLALILDGGHAGRSASPVNATADEQARTRAWEPMPLHTAVTALRRGDVKLAHTVLSRVAREGGATSMVEMQPEGGHGHALSLLFDALG
jgi:hypothetical protein